MTPIHAASRCRLCTRLLSECGRLVCIPSILLEDATFCHVADSAVHQSCYLAWDQREAVARAFVRCRLKDPDPCRHCIYNDDECLIIYDEVAGGISVHSARLLWDIDLIDSKYETWLQGNDDANWPEPSALSVIDAVRGHIRRRFPTWANLQRQVTGQLEAIMQSKQQFEHDYPQAVETIQSVMPGWRSFRWESGPISARRGEADRARKPHA